MDLQIVIACMGDPLGEHSAVDATAGILRGAVFDAADLHRIEGGLLKHLGCQAEYGSCQRRTLNQQIVQGYRVWRQRSFLPAIGLDGASAGGRPSEGTCVL